MITRGIITYSDLDSLKVYIPILQGKVDKSELYASKPSERFQGLTVTSVVAIPGLKQTYKPGDIVLVSFENNEMSSVVIIGYLGSALSDDTSKISLDIEDLNVEGKINLNTDLDFGGQILNFQDLFNSTLPISSVPIGELKILASDKNPYDVYGGGEWMQITEVFPFAASQLGSENPSYTPSEDNKDGGSKDAVIVSHSHETYEYVWSAGSQWGETQQIPNSMRAVRHQLDGGSHDIHYNGNGDVIWYNTTNNFRSPNSSTEGVSGTDKNMPPYKIFYMWQRIA